MGWELFWFFTVCLVFLFVCFNKGKVKELFFSLVAKTWIVSTLNFLSSVSFVFGSQLGMFSHCAHTYEESAAFSVE